MSLHHLIQPKEHLEDEIRQDVIQVRRILPQLGYCEVAVFQEGRRGLLYCALWQRVGKSDDRPAAAGYARVSTVLQSDNHSLVTQIRQQLELAEEKGHDLRYLYLDAGFTGRDDRRPAFARMMRHVVRDRDIAFNYIYDVYRFYRNLHGLTTHYATLQAHQVELVSAADKHTNYASRDGKLLLYLKGILGEMYLDDLSRTTRDNKFSRAQDGYSNASWPPFGYCRGRCLDCTDPNGGRPYSGRDYCPRFGGPELWRELGDDPKVFVPHPIESVAVRMAAEWYATGQYSDKDIAQMLNRHQHPVDAGTTVPLRPKGRPGRSSEQRRFRKDSIRDMLQNPYYAGFVLYRPTKKKAGQRHQAGKRANPVGQTHTIAPTDVIWFPGLHIPLVSQELFERCLRVRGAKGHLPRSHSGRSARVYPLSGVLRCARCGGTFRGTAARGNIRYYEDVERAQGISDCPLRSVRAERLEDPVFAYIQRLRIPHDWHPDILAYLQDDKESRERRRQRRSLESQLRAVRAQFEMGAISQGEYSQARRRVERELRRSDRWEKESEEDLTALLDDFPRLWDAATPLEKKTLLRAVFLDITILDGEISGYVPRDPFTSLFTAR